jgi:ribonuclease III
MATDRHPPLVRLEDRLGHRFRDRTLLLRALTHSSHAHETGDAPDNEALEFFGDALLGFLVAEALLGRFPGESEGALSKMKAWLVSRPVLAEVARDLGLGVHLRLGKAATRQEAGTRESILADAVEAVLAAVHLDGGDAASRALVAHLFGPRLGGIDRAAVEGRDHKTVLQERLQALGRPTPRYRVTATEGPPHRPIFEVEVLAEDAVLARARGGSKKEAEQEAARLALRVIRRGAKGERP